MQPKPSVVSLFGFLPAFVSRALLHCLAEADPQAVLSPADIFVCMCFCLMGKENFSCLFFDLRTFIQIISPKIQKARNILTNLPV